MSNVSGERDVGVTVIRYKKPISPTDSETEVGGESVDNVISVVPGVETFIAWAIGPGKIVRKPAS